MTMREARILKRSRTRFRGGYRGGSGRGSWQIALVLVFGIVGTIGLVGLILKMANLKIKDRRSLIGCSVFLLVVTIFLCSPAIVLLALDDTLVVGILSIISICFLVLPLLIWIPVAVKKSRHFGDEYESKEIADYQAYSTKSEDEKQPHSTYNFLPQNSAPIYSTTVDFDPHAQSSQQPKASAS